MNDDVEGRRNFGGPPRCVWRGYRVVRTALLERLIESVRGVGQAVRCSHLCVCLGAHHPFFWLAQASLMARRAKLACDSSLSI